MSDPTLDQNEIDALLAGISTDEPVGGGEAPAAAPSAEAPMDDFGMDLGGDFGGGSPEASFADEPAHHEPAAHAPAAAPAAAAQYSGGRNIEVLLDVPLEVVVELGSTELQIKEILQLGPGSVVELNRAAGEPINILVNGRLVAKGEVVVVDENFGIKITSIISPLERLNQLN